MRYLPKSPVDREEMLAEIGADSMGSRRFWIAFVRMRRTMPLDIRAFLARVCIGITGR